jgi:hypothetical protein
MKNRLLIIFVFVSLVCNAQTWCPPGAVWNYTANENFSSPTAMRGYTEIRNLGKNTVDGKQCDKLLYSRYRKWGPEGYPCCDPVFENIYTYQDGPVIYFRVRPNVFDTLINFDCPLWKGWSTTYSTSVCPDPYPKEARTTVIDTGHAMVNGFNLKYLLVCWGDSAYAATYSASAAIRIYERIGAIRSFMIPYPWTCSSTSTDYWGFEGDFACYWDNVFPIYKNPLYNLCNYNLTSTNEIDRENSNFLLKPNPAREQFQVFVRENTVLRIHSIEGFLVIEKDVQPGWATIDASDLPKGMYFVTAGRGYPPARLVLQ